MKDLIFIPLLCFLILASNHTTAQPGICDFIVTKAICLENDLKEICVEALDPQGTHVWDITPPPGANCIQTQLTGQKVCFLCNANGSGNFRIDHTVTPTEGLPVSCFKNVNISCNPNCSIWNFISITNQDCSTSLSINPNFLISDPITWVFGDGSNAVQTAGNVKTILHQYSAPGTYTVCVTLSFDESYYQTCCFTIFVPPCPECEPDPISWEECPPSGENCCIKFTFNSPYDSPEFVWDFGDQSLPVTTLNKTVEHNFIGRGPYFICVTYFIEDIPFACCEWIDLPPCDCCESADFVFDVQSFTTYESCMGNVYKCTPLCDRPGMTVHKWIYSDGTIIFTGTPGSPPDHVFQNYVSVTGEVCVTHQILCDNQVIDEVTKCLPFYPGAYLGMAGQDLKMSDILLHQGGITVFDFITQNANNTTIPLYIEGNLIVDINSDFNSGTWNMARGSQIIVNYNRVFGLNGTTIQTAFRRNIHFDCCRWSGIKANTRATLNWSSTTITDAEIMLELLGQYIGPGATLNFTDNDFLENVNGIRAVRHRPRFGNFHHNTFEGCKNCTVLCGCDEGTGIYLDMEGITSLTTNFPVTGSRNIIKNFEYGIHAINTNLSVKNFYIHDVDDTGLWFVKDLANPFNLTMDLLEFQNIPAAVRDQISGGGSHTLTAIASIPQPNSSLKFSEIFRGYDITIDQSQFNGTINNNQIATNGGTANFGIKVSLTGSVGNQFTADHNQITVASGGNSCLGISLLADVDNQQNAVLKFNEITAVGLDPRAGIYVSNWKTSSVTDNMLTMGSPKPGIEFSNSGSSLIQCNNVNFGSKGMLFNISPENDIVNNTCNANGNGAHFFGNCQGTAGAFIGENKFQSNSLEGALYNDDAITGKQQHDKYNSWLPVVSSTKARHNIQSLAEQCQFYAPSNDVNPSQHFPNRVVPVLIMNFGPSAGLPQECSIGSGGEMYEQYHADDSTAGTNYSELLGTEGLFESLDLPLANSLKQSIYELILLWPGWVSAYPNIEAFYNTNQSGFIGQSVALRKQMQDFQMTLENQASALNSLYALYGILAGQLNDLDLQLMVETDPSEIVLILAQMETLRQQMDALILTISGQIQTYHQTNLITINSFQSSNNGLNATTLDEINEKMINDLILKIWRNETLTSTEETELRAIAQYCYNYGGRSVFGARNLCLRLLGEYYDLDDCNYGLRGTNSRLRNSDGLMVLPNPANEELIIKTDGSEANKLPEELKVIENLGKSFDLEVKRVDRFTLVINVKQLVNGVYFSTPKWTKKTREVCC